VVGPPAHGPAAALHGGGLSLRLLLRRARLPGKEALHDLAIEGGTVAAAGPAGSPLEKAGAPLESGAEADLGGRFLLPGLVNALDVLDLAPFPVLGRPPFRNLYEWTASLEQAFPALQGVLAIPLPDRLFLGGLRNLLAGVTAVVHHGPFHRALARDDFPVRVQGRYGFAPSPGQAPRLRRTYRSTDRRIPWFVRASEGTDPDTAAEMDALAAANVLRQNTVVLHGTGLRAEDAARLAAAHACVVWCPETDRRLYAATAPVQALRAAGVRLGLGSDSAAAGSRDALSNLAAARREGTFADDELLRLASEGSGEVARLPVGGFTPGAPADFLVAESVGALLDGDRRAVTLVIVAGRPLCGTPENMEAAGVPSGRLQVEGSERALEASLFRRLRAILRRHPVAARTPWLRDVEVPAPFSRADAV